MKCLSCTAEIPPQWIHAINSNVCPSCGHSIMDDDSQKLLAEVRDAMNQMESNPEGLAGWLISNYKLTKVKETVPEPSVFQTKVGSKSEPVLSPKSAPGTVSPAGKSAGADLLNKFLKRSGMSLPDPEVIKKNKSIMTSSNVDVEEDIDDESGGTPHSSFWDENNFENEVVIPASPTQDPRDFIRQKQIESRKALASGGGKFSRSE